MKDGAIMSGGLNAILAWRHRLVGCSTIQVKILLAFLTTSTITVILGCYSVATIGHSGDLVAETFDRSLMSINYARAAAADFAGMQAAHARLGMTVAQSKRYEIDARIDQLGRTLGEDLQIAAERAQSLRAAQAVHQAGTARSRFTTNMVTPDPTTPPPLLTIGGSYTSTACVASTQQ